MCGITGYVGTKDVKKIVLAGLQSLEYRGYDSAGIAYFMGDNKIKTIKTVGKVSVLRDKVASQAKDDASVCGIGHTRWATHGGVSDTNSHPHTAGKVTLVHNGIIENYKELQDELKEYGLSPVSQTDTEIAAMVINQCYDGNPEVAIRKACQKLQGAYGFCIMFSDIPDTIYAIRNGSPLVASHTEHGSIIASDMVALVSHTKNYFVLKEGHIAKMTPDDIIIKDEEGEIYTPHIHHISWDMAAAKKGGYDYFMMKEIHEQP
ncbi:MAG: class II glutamine amidotransferase, partial [Eubacterium sp.]|nr:class II glutamine amidotransferase [Eubacterium sp.]